MTTRTAVPAAIALLAMAVVAVIAVRPGAVQAPVEAIVGAATGDAAAARAPQSRPVEAAPEQASAPATPARSEGVRLHGVAAPVAKPAGALRLATYNLENLFDPLKPGTPAGKARDDAGEGEAHPVKPAEERRALAAAIRAIDADILAVQEIESLETLTRFRDEHLSDLGYAHIASLDAGDRRGIEQSVLSRYPIKEVANWPNAELGGTHPAKWGRQDNEWAGQPIAFARSPLKVVIEVPVQGASPPRTIPLTLFVVHHKSGGPGGYWREAEAARTAELARAAAEGDRAVAVLGDFNAKREDAPMAKYAAAAFVAAHADKPDTDPVWMSHTSGRVIDHILLSPSLAKMMVKETRFVLGTPTRPEGVDWRTTPNPPGWASDHYPVVVDFRFE